MTLVTVWNNNIVTMFFDVDVEIPNAKDILTSPDREIRVIKLRKEPFKGLGKNKLK